MSAAENGAEKAGKQVSESEAARGMCKKAEERERINKRARETHLLSYLSQTGSKSNKIY